MIGQDTFMLQSMNVTINFTFKIWHPPAPIDQEKAYGQDDFNTSAGQVAPVANVWKAKALHYFVQVLHVLPNKRYKNPIKQIEKEFGDTSVFWYP